MSTRMDFSKVKFRASRIGDLMTGGRGKSDLWGETALKYLDEIYIGMKYGRYKDVKTKYMTKGIEAEEDSITLLSTINKKVYRKNTVNFSNEFVTGTPDIIDLPTIIDTKTSWDLHTFRASLRTGFAKGYEYQLQTYLWLEPRANIGQVSYCLVNTPEELILDELRRLSYVINPESDRFAEAEEKIRNEMTFDDIPASEKTKTFTIERDNELIQFIEQRCIDARALMNEMYN
jgi:hypothetical protein